MKYRIGIDVGGTNTDAVVVDGKNHIIAKYKSNTTEDVITGIKNAVTGVIKNAKNINIKDITHAMLGTTHAANAIVQRKNLLTVGVVRLSAPSGLSIPPFTEWPDELMECIGRHYRIVKGGYEYTGACISDTDDTEIDNALHELRSEGIQSLAVSCAFSLVNSEQEKKVYQKACNVFGKNFPISLSSEIGGISLLDRENATILNSAIWDVMRTAFLSFKSIMNDCNFSGELFVTQNDGTLMQVEQACKYPVLTIASGATNSLRGAAFLSGLRDCIVVDVGGTTTDVGFLQKGFPRESSKKVEIGGVCVNFRMPDLVSIGLGGGSIIHKERTGYAIGPDSVGRLIKKEATIFAGGTITATDIAVYSGLVSLGDPKKVSDFDKTMVHDISKQIRDLVEESIDRMKTTSDDIPVVLVGGGSIILPKKINGASSIVIPDNFDVANAIGAAIAQISASIDVICDITAYGRDTTIDSLKKETIKKAVVCGATEKTVEIVEIQEIPLAYMPSGTVRFKIKAVGELQKEIS